MKERISEKDTEKALVKNEPAMWIKTDGSIEYGRLMLNSHTLFFARNSDTGSGLLRLFMKENTEPAVSIDLDTVNTISNETYMTDSNVLSITYMQYENVRFSVINYDEWENAIHKQQEVPHIQAEGDTP